MSESAWPDLSGKTILQVIPDLSAGGAERTTVEMAEAISGAGGRALVASEGGRLEPALEAVGGAMVLCADHGNCETMIDPETGGPPTAHTLNLVPVAVVGQEGQLRDGRLADLAPTLLMLMGLAQPDEMTGVSLIA